MYEAAYNKGVNTHIAIYHSKSSGILSAAIDMEVAHVILLYRTEDDISGIKAALQSRGISCVSHAMSFDAEKFRTAIQEIINSNLDKRITFNASSGYRKWVLLAYEQCFLLDIPVIMIDKFENTLHWINKKHSEPDRPLKPVLKIGEYLKLFQTQILDQAPNRPEPANQRSVTQWIITHLQSHLNEIASLNHLAMMADNKHRAQINRNLLRNNTFMGLLSQLEEAKQLRISKNRITFTDDKTRFFCNGGWLENHVYAEIYGMRTSRKNISDVSKSVVVSRSKGQIKNELDVVTMVNNRLHIIECKTSKMEKTSQFGNTASSAIYRLDTLKSLTGGLSGKAMLISFRPLSRHTLSRAKDLNIYCCSHTQLSRLRSHLYRFFDQELT